jgi:3-methyl-2-oxobutanoate hydroxymethyltransferase
MANGKEREQTPSGRVTVRTLRRMKTKGERITMLTCYDATFARILDAAGADVLLVGDSLGMVIQGHETTLPVTVDEMIYHCKAVVRGTKRAQVVGDLPFMSYQTTDDDGVRNAGRLLQEGGVQAVKLEGGERVCPLVRRLVDGGIPVMGHLGLTPQSINAFGGYRIQGRSADAGERILRDALALQDAGAYSIVLEGVPWPLAQRVTEALEVPTIGIGAGRHCDGQVLVIYDLLGMDPDFKPRFVKAYDDLHGRIGDAVREYRTDVREGRFPTADHSFE